MHKNDLWQEYSGNGEPIKDGGHPPEYFDKTIPRPLTSNAQIWLYRDTPTGRELLFQLRSPSVHNGDVWDVSAGGHIDYGETRLDAAVRETYEEIGADVDPGKLQFVFSCKRPDQSTIHNIFLYDYTGQPDDFHFNDSEVADLKWVPLSILDDFLENGGVKPVLATFDWYWQFLREHLDCHEN